MRSTRRLPSAQEARKSFGVVMSRAPAAARLALRRANAQQQVPQVMTRPGAQSTPKFKGRDGKPLARPAVQGVACIFDTVVTIKGERVLFWRSCFDDAIQDGDIKLLLDHDASKEVGATAAGLEFAVTGPDDHISALVFRMPLSDDEDSQRIVDTISHVERPCMSVGVNADKSYMREIDGHQVKVILKATLMEVSLVPEGAVPGTSISLVDLADEPASLIAAARTEKFAVDKLISNADGKFMRIERDLREVVAKTRVVSDQLLEAVSRRRKVK